jgi:hypothetical protein
LTNINGVLKYSFILCRDNIPAILLAEWDLSTEYFDEDFLSGIMPVLFARDPRAAKAGIKANPETAMKDLDKLNRIFFIPESVELDGALKIVKRARLGDVDFGFKRKNLDRVFEPEPFIQGKKHRFNFRNLIIIHTHILRTIWTGTSQDQSGAVQSHRFTKFKNFKFIKNEVKVLIQNFQIQAGQPTTARVSSQLAAFQTLQVEC